MTEYQVPGCWLVTSEVVTSTSEAVTSEAVTSEAVTSTMKAQSKHDEIQEKMAATRGANMTKFKKKWPRHVARSKHVTKFEKKRKKFRLRRICEPAAQSGPTRRASN